MANHWSGGRRFCVDLVPGRRRICPSGAVLVSLGVVALMAANTVGARLPIPMVSGSVPSVGGPLLAAGLFGSFECIGARITLNGIVVCANQTLNSYRLSGPGGGNLSFELAGSPVSGNQTWGWIVSGGCLQSQSPCRTSSLSNPVELYAGCASGQHCVVVVSYQVLTAPLFGSFTCVNSEITLNGTVVCDNQTGNVVPISGVLGGPFWFNLDGTPGPGNMFWGWNVSGGCLAGAFCSGSTSDPVILSASCATGDHCVVYVTVIVVVSGSGTTCYSAAQGSIHNWAGGYAIACPAGYVTEVSSSWIQPSVSCPTVSADALFWAGIDSWPPVLWIEQAGVQAMCFHSANGTQAANYTAFYEFYPSAEVPIKSITVHPGDKISVTITYESTAANGSEKFRFVLADSSQQFSANLWDPWSGVPLSSAESIVEVTAVGDVWALANFNVAEFGSSYTGILACGATIHGVTAALGSFPGVEAVNGTGYLSGLPLARTSAFTGSGSSFTVTWERLW